MALLTALPTGRAGALVQALQLAPHPEGGWYREIFRSAAAAPCADGRGTRQALTCIDFLLAAGERSAWHAVASDEAWHLLEGGPLQLWLLPPDGSALQVVTLGPVTLGPVTLAGAAGAAGAAVQGPRHVVPAHWWQAAVPAPGSDFALVGATVGPGFDFADFRFGRDAPALVQAVQQLGGQAAQLL